MNEEILKHLNNHEFQEAIHLLDSELKKNSLNYDGYCTRAQCYEKLGKYEEGLHDCDRAIEINPKCCHAYLYKGNILRNLERFDDAKATFEEALKYNGDIHIMISIQEHLNFVIKEIEEKKEEEAGIFLDNEVLSMYDPSLVDAVSKMKGVVQNSTGDENIDKMIVLGYLHVNSRKFDIGIKIFNQLLKHNPKLTAGYLGKGTAFALMGDFISAIENFSSVLSYDPSCVDAYKRRGQTRVAIGDYQGGIDDLSKAVELEKSHDSYFQRGLIYLNTRNFNRAIKDFIVAAKYDPSHIETYNQIGICYNATGRSELAEKFYKKALDIDKNYKETIANLGQTYKEWGRFDDAMEQFKLALQLDPHFVKAHHLKALAYHAKGRHREAIESLTNALNIDPNHFESRWMRAVYRFTLGLIRDSIEDFEVALQFSKDHHCWYQKEIALYWHHHLDVPFNQYNIDFDLDPAFKEWLCKKNPPSSLPRPVNQPPLNPNIPDVDLNIELNDDKKRLLKFAWEIGIMIHQETSGFTLNERQIKMTGLAAIEIAQTLRKHKIQKLTLDGKSSSGNREPHTFGWRDLYDITAKWRQFSEPNDPVWWVDRLTPEQFAEGFGSHTSMLFGQIHVIRYYAMFDRAFEILKRLTLEQLSISPQKKEKVLKAKTCDELHNIIGKDFWVVTPCHSTCVKGKILEGTRLTLSSFPPEGYEFSIRTPGTPPRWLDYEAEFEYVFDNLMNELYKDNPSLEEFSKWILTMTFYWYNLMPLSRGTAATGYIGLLGMFLAFGIQITSKIPKNEMIDWDGILLPTPTDMINKFSTWLYPGRTPLDMKFFDSLPQVSEAFPTLRELIIGLTLPYE